MNCVVLIDVDSSVEGYAACSCGRRYPLSPSAERRLVNLATDYDAIPRRYSSGESWMLDSLLDETTWPLTRVSALAKQGIVPVGTPVLHSPTARVKVLSKGLVRFGHHMISAMDRANGIGLAANQVGVPLRVLAHNLDRVIPQVMVNPEILASTGRWSYEEGCLSLQVADTQVEVRRPKVITVAAVLLNQKVIVVRADELLGRVLQHEIDHLDGIEYVQRLEGELQREVYDRIAERGIDLTCIPVRPYRMRR